MDVGYRNLITEFLNTNHDRPISNVPSQTTENSAKVA